MFDSLLRQAVAASIARGSRSVVQVRPLARARGALGKRPPSMLHHEARRSPNGGSAAASQKTRPASLCGDGSPPDERRRARARVRYKRHTRCAGRSAWPRRGGTPGRSSPGRRRWRHVRASARHRCRGRRASTARARPEAPGSRACSRGDSQRGRQRVATRVIDPARAAGVTLDLAIVEELGDRGLDHRRAVAIGGRALLGKAREERRGRDAEADAQPGGDDLGEPAAVRREPWSGRPTQPRPGIFSLADRPRCSPSPRDQSCSASARTTHSSNAATNTGA